MTRGARNDAEKKGQFAIGRATEQGWEKNAWIASAGRAHLEIRCGTRQKGLGNGSADSGLESTKHCFSTM